MDVFAVAAALVALQGTAGLYGTVVISPSQPVCVAGKTCSAPDKHELLTFTQNGRITRTTTDDHGRYRVMLGPGRYVVAAPHRHGIGRGLEPHSVIVRAGRYARVNFTIDIGIR